MERVHRARRVRPARTSEATSATMPGTLPDIPPEQSPLIAERFNRDAIDAIFVSLREQKRFNSFKVWNLLNLVLWHERWFTATSTHR
jgi:hypothetical protein